MNKDIRLSVSFFSHPKTIKLKSLLGPSGILSLLSLWCYAGQWKHTGDLSGMTEEEIECAALWVGSDKLFFKTIRDCKFLDEDFKLHDWKEHNPWAFGAELRSKKAKISAYLKHGMEEEANALRNELNISAERMRNASVESTAERTAPSPSPSPSPKHNPRAVFVPPTVEEVRLYIQERCSGVDAQAFCDFYESKGWMIGKNRMKSWQAAVRTWEKSQREAVPDISKQTASSVPAYKRGGAV